MVGLVNNDNEVGITAQTDMGVMQGERFTFQEVGLVGPLRVHSCVEAPWQILPQHRDQDGCVVASSVRHCPNILTAEDICLAKRTWVVDKY